LQYDKINCAFIDALNNGDNMNNNKLESKLAFLESQIDLLETELAYLEEMLLRVGFPEGIKTLKAAVEEYLASEEAPIFIERKKSVE
jgi:hypothetical protein